MSRVTKRCSCPLPDARGDFPHCHLVAPRRPWVLRIQKQHELNAEDEPEYDAGFTDMQKNRRTKKCPGSQGRDVYKLDFVCILLCKKGPDVGILIPNYLYMMSC